jgi:hypothetical protein
VTSHSPFCSLPHPLLLLLILLFSSFQVRSNIGFTPLIYACQRGHLDMCTLLADRGADIEACNNFGQVNELCVYTQSIYAPVACRGPYPHPFFSAEGCTLHAWPRTRHILRATTALTPSLSPSPPL